MRRASFGSLGMTTRWDLSWPVSRCGGNGCILVGAVSCTGKGLLTVGHPGDLKLGSKSPGTAGFPAPPGTPNCLGTCDQKPDPLVRQSGAPGSDLRTPTTLMLPGLPSIGRASLWAS